MDADDQDLIGQVRRALLRTRLLPDLLSLDVAGLRDDAALLAAILSNVVPPGGSRAAVNELANAALRDDVAIVSAARADVEAAAARNLEPGGVTSALLFYRGFHALLAYRVCHYFWKRDDQDTALGIKSTVERSLASDIHPGARIGKGVWFDHGVGVVIGATAIIEDDVSMWHGVTLGSTLKDSGSCRHPRVRRGATIGASAIVLGAIEIGENAVVAAGAVVLRDVPPGVTVAGVPARQRARDNASFRGFVVSGDEA